MLAQVWSAAVRGIDGYAVAVELDLANGLPVYATVGLPDSAVKESRERVAAALRNCGFQFPCRRVTVNLAPAEFRKRGTQFDLPVALGILAASGQLASGDWMTRYCFIGELALDGGVKPVSGVLPMALAARAAGMKAVVTAQESAPEAASAGIPSYGMASLREAAGLLTGGVRASPASVPPAAETADGEDLADVRGQTLAKRALEIAAAGGHHLLLVGPPGAGKSMLARRLPGLLPPLEERAALEVAKIRSATGTGPPGERPASRPFRAPHHTATAQALVGGGNPCRPGEATLAHGGVLFLDELGEFRRDCLEALRVPLETGTATVSRLQDRVEFPAGFLLVAAMNPCPCGRLGQRSRECVCTPPQVARYRSRVSGPLLDRMDLRVEVAPLSFSDWSGGTPGGSGTREARERVGRARSVQAARFGSAGRTNAGMSPGELREHCRLSAEGRALLESFAARFAVSARGLDRVLKVARTVADMEERPCVEPRHLAEAAALSGRERA